MPISAAGLRGLGWEMSDSLKPSGGVYQSLTWQNTISVFLQKIAVSISNEWKISSPFWVVKFEVRQDEGIHFRTACGRDAKRRHSLAMARLFNMSKHSLRTAYGWDASFKVGSHKCGSYSLVVTKAPIFLQLSHTAQSDLMGRNRHILLLQGIRLSSLNLHHFLLGQLHTLL